MPTIQNGIMSTINHKELYFHFFLSVLFAVFVRFQNIFNPYFRHDYASLLLLFFNGHANIARPKTIALAIQNPELILYANCLITLHFLLQFISYNTSTIVTKIADSPVITPKIQIPSMILSLQFFDQKKTHSYLSTSLLYFLLRILYL